MDEASASPIIDDELWLKARDHISKAYSSSTALPLCLQILDTFASISKMNYRTDLMEFIHESKLEDFLEETGDMVLVSTMHKAKGKQFDSVYLMLNSFSCSGDKKRAVYVALTRAKSALHIHTNTDYFDRFDLPGILRKNDSHDYPEPDEILLELGHRDVMLGYFRYRQKVIPSLRSGDKLKLDGDHLCLPDPGSARVVKLSRRCAEQLEEAGKKGYRVCSAEIRFIVWWKGQDEPEESAIILPNLYLLKEPHDERERNQED